MKKFSVFPLLAALAVFVSCQKQQTEEERKAEVERQVQDRLAAEHADAEKKRLEDDRASLEAREKALAEREAASPTPVEVPATIETEQVVTETSDGGSSAEAQSTAAYGMFYEKLDPYGEWRETSDYGYVWQPREAETSRDWRPYTEGRWVYSDAGWTWVSEEKFGWATYHYGRWVRLRRVGWVWVPGDQWAPAWVSWRTSKDYVGWAPLPPEARFDRKSGIQNWADSYYDIGPDQYSFVASNDFGSEHVRRSVVPAERNTDIVIATTNVTRITFSNTMIMNEGPSYDELRSRGQRPIERYRLRRRNNYQTETVSGAELEVSQPLIVPEPDFRRPRRVKERVTEVNVDNGWTSVSDRSAVERARTKMRAEATPPPNAPPKKFVPPAETAASSTPAATVATTPMAVPPSAPPARSATPTPAPTTASSATTSPVASASPRTRPSPSMRPRPSPSPTAIATASSTPLPTVSTTPRTRPSPSIPVRMSPTPLPAASAAVTTPPVIPRRTLPPVSTTPAPTRTPSATTESSVKPVPTIPPVKRPSIPPRTTLPTPTVAPETNEAARPPAPRDVPRRTVRPQMTPPPLATPTAAPEKTETTSPPPPRDIPRRTIPQRMTPPPAATPAATPSVAPSPPAVSEERTRNRRPRPAPGATESGTPTPAPR